MGKVPKQAIILVLLLLLLPFRWAEVSTTTNGATTIRWVHDRWSQSDRQVILMGNGGSRFNDAYGWMKVDEATMLWCGLVLATGVWWAVDARKKKPTN